MEPRGLEGRQGVFVFVLNKGRWGAVTLAFITSTALLVASAPSAGAYSHNAGRFGGSNLSFTVAGSYADSWYNASANWTNLSDVNITYTSSPIANIQGNSVARSDVGWDGLASYPSVYNGVWQGGVLVFLNTHFVAGYTQAKRNGVANHEFGHALGLGHSSNTAVLMYTNTPQRIYNLPQPDDRNGVNAKY